MKKQRILTSAVFLSAISLLTLALPEQSAYNPISVVNAEHDTHHDDHSGDGTHSDGSSHSGSHGGKGKGFGKGGVSHKGHSSGGHSVEDSIFHGKHGKRWTDEWPGADKHGDEDHDDHDHDEHS